MRRLEQLLKLCEPLVEYLRQEQNPYTEIVVSMDFVKMKKEELSIPVLHSNKVTEHREQSPKLD